MLEARVHIDGLNNTDLTDGLSLAGLTIVDATTALTKISITTSNGALWLN